jgi:multicomponent Na+:H+ antiporter subunit B
VGTRFLFPLLLVVSVFLLLRGHNQPGGGFVGGLVAAAAFALVMLSEGPAKARQALHVEPMTLVAAGLLAAMAAGIMALAAGRPLLTGLWLKTPLPVIGKLGTPLLFDLGVYGVVVGVTLAMFLALAED